MRDGEWENCSGAVQALQCAGAWQGTRGGHSLLCAVVTAKTGVKIFWPSFLLLDRLTTLQKGSWPFDRTYRPRGFTSSFCILTAQLRLKLVFDLLTATKNTTWPLDHFLTPVLAVTTAVYGMTAPWGSGEGVSCYSSEGGLQGAADYWHRTHEKENFSFSSRMWGRLASYPGPSHPDRKWGRGGAWVWG